MSNKAMSWAIDCQVKGSHKLVLMLLADAHNGHTGLCFPSQAWIIEKSGLAESTVSMALKDLEDWKLIERKTKALGRGKGSQRHFELNLQILDPQILDLQISEFRHPDSGVLDTQISGGQYKDEPEEEPEGNRNIPTTSGQSPENGLFGELPEDEKPKAPKPEPASDDPRAQVWALAPPYLEANGTGARQARSLTGKLIKTCGPGDALIIAKSMIASETQDPVNYLGGAMRRHKAGEPPEEIRPKPKFEATDGRTTSGKTIYRHIATGALVVAGETGWIRLEEVTDHEPDRPGCGGNGPVGAGADGQHAAANMPEVQPQPEEETRSMPRHLKAGAGDVDALPSLRLGGKA